MEARGYIGAWKLVKVSKFGGRVNESTSERVGAWKHQGMEV
jgi:hypothetical protein